MADEWVTIYYCKMFTGGSITATRRMRLAGAKGEREYDVQQTGMHGIFIAAISCFLKCNDAARHGFYALLFLLSTSNEL